MLLFLISAQNLAISELSLNKKSGGGDMEIFVRIGDAIFRDRIILLTIYAVLVDTFFGVLRAIRERSFNTTVGIDGLIRKAAMIFAVILLVPVDMALNVNLIGFIPEAGRTWLGIKSVGVAELFAILFACYEVVSILKNMTLCGLPLRNNLGRICTLKIEY